MVYLAKPVIKKVPREEKGRKKRQAPAAPPPEPRPSRSRRPALSGEYESLPRGQQVAGPQHQPTLPPKEAPSPRAVRENVQRTTVLPPSQQPPAAGRPCPPKPRGPAPPGCPADRPGGGPPLRASTRRGPCAPAGSLCS